MYFRTGNPKGLTESGSGELGIIVCGHVPWLYQYWPVGLCSLWFFVQELLEAQPAVVLVLKRLRRRGKKKTFCGFSMGRNQYWAGRVYDLCVYYMTGTPEGSTESGFMEKPGIEPATPGLQGIALIHYTTRA